MTCWLLCEWMCVYKHCNRTLLYLNQTLMCICHSIIPPCDKVLTLSSVFRDILSHCRIQMHHYITGTSPRDKNSRKIMAVFHFNLHRSTGVRLCTLAYFHKDTASLFFTSIYFHLGFVQVWFKTTLSDVKVTHYIYIGKYILHWIYFLFLSTMPLLYRKHSAVSWYHHWLCSMNEHTLKRQIEKLLMSDRQNSSMLFSCSYLHVLLQCECNSVQLTPSRSITHLFKMAVCVCVKMMSDYC